jgi:predicted dehydrogenase
MIKAAVLGLGWWGKHIVGCLADSKRIQITHVVELDLKAAAAFAADHDFKLTDDYSSVLNDPAIDAVIITTPNLLHEEQVLAAAAAGKHAFCEKPLALKAAAAERMLAACDANSVCLGIGHERRFEDSLEEMKRMADSGELGKLLHYEVNASYNLFVGAPEDDWRQDPAQSPAGLMTALGVHQTDYMQTILGPVDEVQARLTHRSESYSKDDVLSIQFVFKSGVIGNFNSLATTPFYQRMTLFGDRGWVELRETANVDKPDPALLTWRGMDIEIHTRTYERTDTVTQNLYAWADAVEGKGDYRFTRQELLHNVEILEAIVTSAATGKSQVIRGQHES